MANEAHFSVVGFIATQPKSGITKTGTQTLSMRVGWTPRIFDRTTSAWADQPSSFITVQCYKKAAEHGSVCLRRGDPVVVKGTLRVREYVDQAGVRRSSVEVLADSIGHDLSRGIAVFNKTQAQVEQTAFEHERAMAAAGGRNPLPGDREAAEPVVDRAVRQGVETSDADPGEAGGTDDDDDRRDAEFGASESLDEDDGRGDDASGDDASGGDARGDDARGGDASDTVADLDEAPKPVGALV
jgi:single-strand DNA-binding protein